MALDYLNESARAALVAIAERVFSDELAGVLAGEDASPLMLDDEANASMSITELDEALGGGDIWEDGGAYYLDEGLLGELTGQMASVVIGNGDVVYPGSTVMFEWESVRHCGWVTGISSVGDISIHHDDGTDWTVGVGDVVGVQA